MRLRPQVAELDRRYRELAAERRRATKRRDVTSGREIPTEIAPHLGQNVAVSGAGPDVIRYEHPLNERIRTMMRLEDLYRRALFFNAATAPADHHAALLALVRNRRRVVARRSQDRHPAGARAPAAAARAAARTIPRSSTKRSTRCSPRSTTSARACWRQSGKVGAHLRDNEWLMAIKQRTALPGGVSEFDLPAFHYWLHLDPAARQRDLQAWLAPLLPIHEGLSIVLRILRENGKTGRHTAVRGVFQLMLTTAKVAQLLRLVHRRPTCRACPRSAPTSTR